MNCNCHDLFCHHTKVRQNVPYQKLSYEVVEEVFQYIKHGDEEHQQWLRSALFCFANGLPKPD